MPPESQGMEIFSGSRVAGTEGGSKMLNIIKGAHVPDAASLCEAYTIGRQVRGLTAIHANVGADKLLPLFTAFIRAHRNEMLFFILEIPCNQGEEQAIGNKETAGTHKNVYYIDGLSEEEAYAILQEKGELLVHDGVSAFGFGGHDSQEELTKSRYNCCTAFTKDIPAFAKLLEGQRIFRTEHLVTAWDTFSQEQPGCCMTYSVDGELIYDLVSYFKDWGIYLAEQRED